MWLKTQIFWPFRFFPRIDDTATCADLNAIAPCIASYPSNQISALDYVSSLFANIAAVNLSLGGGAYTSNCDQIAPWDRYKISVDTLRAQGIATVVASGNDGLTDAISAPACISTAISVGATTKSDTVASYSNSASFLNLLAPGGDGSGGSGGIYSSVPGGGFAYLSGTSMAAPHVAGAFAILKQQSPTANVSDISSILQSNGVPVIDPRNNITKPRIRVSNTPWIARYNGGYDDGLNQIFVDSAGNSYVSGTTCIDVDCLSSRLVTIKYETSGNIKWTTQYSLGTYIWPNSITMDVMGNVYIAGEECPTDLCDSEDAFVIKYDPQGNLLWTVIYNQGSFDSYLSIRSDTAGNVYVGGYSCNEVSNCDAVITKYNSTGALLWEQRIGNGNRNQFVSVAVDSAGNVIAAGSSCNTYTCQSTVGNSTKNETSALTVKYDTDGSLLWTMREPSPSAGVGVIVNTVGDVYLVGASELVINRGDGTTYHTTGGGLLTIKYDAAGAGIWSRIYGTVGHGVGIVLDKQDRPVVAGQKCDDVQCQSSFYATVKYDPNGNQLFQASFGSGNQSSASDIVTDDQDNTYVVGCVNYSQYGAVRYDLNGNQTWSVVFDSPCTWIPRIAVDALRNIYVNAESYSGSDGDIITLKYTP